jgi:hypothetical protein
MTLPMFLRYACTFLKYTHYLKLHAYLSLNLHNHINKILTKLIECY